LLPNVLPRLIAKQRVVGNGHGERETSIVVKKKTFWWWVSRKIDKIDGGHSVLVVPMIQNSKPLKV